MTIGTGIVVSIALLCVTFIATLCIGANLANKKQEQIKQFSEETLKKKNKL